MQTVIATAKQQRSLDTWWSGPTLPSCLLYIDERRRNEECAQETGPFCAKCLFVPSLLLNNDISLSFPKHRPLFLH